MKINLLSVSGGKDSTAMLLYAIERETQNMRLVFADTGHEHALTYEYLDYLETRLCVKIDRVKADFTEKIANKRAYIQEHWLNDSVPPERVQQALDMLKPTGVPFLDMCIWKGRFPSTKVRFCTDELKRNPIDQYLKPLRQAGKKIRSWQGVRRDESRARATAKMHERGDFGVWIYRPLVSWTAQDVFEIHRRHGVDPNPLYKMGMSRVGCMPCIMCRKNELFEISRRFPDVIDRLEKWEEYVSHAAKRGSGTFFPAVSTGTESDDKINRVSHGIRKAVEWSMTERGGKQFDLFKAGEEIPECSSNYGLCELPENETTPDSACADGGAL